MLSHTSSVCDTFWETLVSSVNSVKLSVFQFMGVFALPGTQCLLNHIMQAYSLA